MKLEANKLRLSNIGQLIQVASQGTLTMGKLERFKKRDDSDQISLRISGDTVVLQEDSIVSVMRTPEHWEMRQVGMGIDDLVDGMEAQGLPTLNLTRTPSVETV